MGLQQLLGSIDSGTPDGQENYITTAGTYSWLCPPGVTSVSVVCIGAGGAGGGGQSNIGSGLYAGGGGGGCAYKNNISVTPGQSYTVVVGASKYNASVGETDGGDSYFINASTVMGKGGQSNSQSGYNGGYASQCVGDGKYSGGNGGAYSGGGYGGAGSSGNGSNGSNGNTSAAGNGGGGGAGGGGTGNQRGVSGGGSPNGQHIGAAGGGGGSNNGAFAGGGGGGGNIGTVTGTNPADGGAAFINWYGGGGGKWGGGGGGSSPSGGLALQSGIGAVRIIWSTSGAARAFPGTNIGDL